MKQNNSWCCKMTSKTFKLFQRNEIYEDTCERGCILFYWKKVEIDKEFCEKCQKICKKEEIKLQEDSRKEIEKLEKDKKTEFAVTARN